MLRVLVIIALLLPIYFVQGAWAGTRVHELEEEINFGLVANSETYKIYRSAGLGESGLRDLKEILAKRALPFPKTIISMNDEGYIWTWFMGDTYVLEEYDLRNSSAYGPYKYYHAYGPQNERTYLEGYSPRKPLEDIDAKNDKLNERATRLFGKNGDSKVDGGMESFRRILKLILDPKNQPVLFHCHGGRHRTGMVALTLRKLQGDKALQSPVRPNSKWNTSLETVGEKEYFRYAEGSIFAPPREDNVEFVRSLVKSKEFQQMKEEFGLLLK